MAFQVLFIECPYCSCSNKRSISVIENYTGSVTSSFPCCECAQVILFKYQFNPNAEVTEILDNTDILIHKTLNRNITIRPKRRRFNASG